MAICRDCNKEVVTGYQVIKTKRNTEITICDDCIKKAKREVERARDSH